MGLDAPHVLPSSLQQRKYFSVSFVTRLNASEIVTENQPVKTRCRLMVTEVGALSYNSMGSSFAHTLLSAIPWQLNTSVSFLLLLTSCCLFTYSSNAMVPKLRPAGQIRPATPFFMALQNMSVMYSIPPAPDFNTSILFLPVHSRWRLLTGCSRQKRLERLQRPAAIHFQCTLATMSNRSDATWATQGKLREAQLYANEQRRDRSDSQLWADLDSEGGKRQKERKTMEEKLIIAVSAFPELYDTSLFVYGDNQKKLCLEEGCRPCWSIWWVVGYYGYM